jgi:hypothetical protein
MKTITAIIEEHRAFCNLGQETLCAIDPEGQREQEIIQCLFDAYEDMKEEQDAADEFWDNWNDMNDMDKYDTIVEEAGLEEAA